MDVSISRAGGSPCIWYVHRAKEANFSSLSREVSNHWSHGKWKVFLLTFAPLLGVVWLRLQQHGSGGSGGKKASTWQQTFTTHLALSCREPWDGIHLCRECRGGGERHQPGLPRGWALHMWLQQDSPAQGPAPWLAVGRLWGQRGVRLPVC